MATIEVNGILNVKDKNGNLNMIYPVTKAENVEGLSGGKRTARFTVGTSVSGWTANDCDYLCDGTADQTEINAAIQALPSTGGEIVILDGTYNITATIAINKDNVKLSGNGAATILKRMYDGSISEGLISITAVNGGCFIGNLKIDGNRTVYTGNTYGIKATCDNNIISGNTFIDNYRSISLEGENNNVTCNLFKNSMYNNVYCSGNGNTVSDNACNGGSLTMAGDNNTVSGNACNGGDISITGDDNAVVGNTCYNNQGDGISAKGNNNAITGNTCNNNRDFGIDIGFGDNITVTGNTCNNNDRGISNIGDNVAITGNTCNNNGYCGIYLSGMNNAIIGNTCNNNDKGIDISGEEMSTITGNTCANNNTGIDLVIAKRCNISGNVVIRGNGTSSDYTSSQNTIDSSSTVSIYNLIACNVIMGKNYVSGGTGNTFVENKYQ